METFHLAKMYILDRLRFHLHSCLAGFLCLSAIPVFFAAPVLAVEPVGLGNLEHFERLPYLKDGVKSWLVSAHGKAGFDDYIESYKEREHILLDVKGPGSIYRMFFTEKSTHARIKVFVDDQPSPVINQEYYSFINNLSFPFVPPLVGDYKLSNGGYCSYLPIPFKKSCRVVVQGILPMFFYNITYHTFSTEEGVETFDLKMSGDRTERLHKIKEMWQAVGTQPKKFLSEKIIERTINLTPGKTGILLGVSGAGAITSFKLDISPPNKEILNNCRLVMVWDNESSPSVDVPLGHFFGSGLGKEIDFKSLPIGMSTTGWYYCYFPMPYWKSAKIMVINNSGQKVDQLKYEIRYTQKPYEKGRAAYFKTYYNKEHPTTRGKPYTILKTQGQGHYMGVVITAGGQSRGVLEGGERIYIDDSAYPQLWGSGFEAFVGGAWYFGRGFFSLPTHGFTAKGAEKLPSGKKIRYVNCYRFHLSDYYPFYSSINVVLAHGNNSMRKGYYSSVAYYYAVNTPKLILTDEIDVGNTLSEREHNYIAADYKNLGKIKSSYEDKAKTKFLSDEGVEIGKYSQFKINITRDNQGIRLRKRTFHKNSPQVAKVWVDGKLVGNWDILPNPIPPMWLETEFEIPAKYTAGKNFITVKIEPVTSNSKQKWNEFYYWIYAYRP